MPKAFWRDTLIAVLVLSAAIALINPVAEIGMNDDWSYVRTAYDLASTGHLRYNGWAAPIIGFQAWWGAAFLRLFGYSFTTARASTEVLTLLFIPLLLRLFRRAGVADGGALFATLALLLSPLLLVGLTSFMTDIPAFLLFAGALLATMEAWHTPAPRRAIFWMLLALLFGALSGSVRQVYWAGVVWFLFVLAVARFQSIGQRVLACCCLFSTLFFALLVTHWQKGQPYVSTGPSFDPGTNWTGAISVGGNYMLRFFVDWAVLMLPVSAAFFSLRLRPRWLLLTLAALSGWLVFHLAQPLPWVGNTLTEYGGMVSGLVAAGEKPLVLAPLPVWLIGTAGLFALAVAAVSLLKQRVPLPRETVRFAILTLPFLCVYVTAIAMRGPVYGIYDRYSTPVIAILGTLLLAARQQKTPKISWAFLWLFAFYGVAVTHDSYAEARARLDAANRLLQSGVKRTQILAGFEFDCWTQVEQTGYVNNELIKIPAGAYKNADDCSGPDDVQFWWHPHTPAIRANYVVSLSKLDGLEPGIVVQSSYKTWLPYGTRQVYVQHSSQLLTCQSE